MDELIVRFLQGVATSEDEQRLQEWRNRSQRNEAEFQDLAAVWSTLAEAEIDTVPPSTGTLVRQAVTPKVVPMQRPAPSRLRGSGSFLAAAAVLILVAGSALFLTFMRSGESRGLEPMHLATGSGQTTMTQLSDGTIVHLAPNSTLEVAGGSDAREVIVDGRAFFGVAKASDWPFVVRSRVGTARVLGTRFEFSTEDGDARVIVVDGRVMLSTERGDVEVAAGEMTMTPPNSPPLVTEFDDTDRLLGWMGQSLVFHDTPLLEAAREIEARYGVSIDIQEAELAGETISGGFKDRSFPYVVATICRVLYVECEITETSAVIAGRP